jgi:biopolymer transport protein ExbD
MAGASVETGKRGGRRSLDSEINMIPMIDLLMVTISFLLITAVWVRMSRIDANAQVPGAPDPCSGIECAPTRTLHLEMRDQAKFALYWVDGSTEVRRTEVARRDVLDTVGKAKIVRYPGLREAIEKEWTEMGRHRAPTDHELDRLVLHTDDASSYAQVVGAMDAVHGVERPITVGGKTGPTSAFHVTFSAK